MASWLKKICNNIFGSFQYEIEKEPKKKDCNSKIEQPEDKGGKTDETEDKGIQQRRTCHFIVVFPRTAKQDSNSLKRAPKNSSHDESPNHVQSFNKSLSTSNEMHENMPEIPRRQKQLQEKQDGCIQNSVINQSAGEDETRKSEKLASQGLYNMDHLQPPEMLPEIPHDDLCLNFGDFDDRNLENVMENFPHGAECIFMENLMCDLSGSLSQGEESFQTEARLSPNKSSPTHLMLNESHSEIKQYYETRFSNGTNIVNKRKRNLDFYNDDLEPKMKREVKKEVLDSNIVYKSQSPFFIERQNISLNTTNDEESTDCKFHDLILATPKPMFKSL